MTILLCLQQFRPQQLLPGKSAPATELSSRPERSAVEGPAVSSPEINTL
jgi:hypothetical protein